MFTQRPIAASELRPRRWWYVFAAVLAVAGVATGVGFFVTMLIGLKPTHTWNAGQTVTARLHKSPRPAFYVSDAGSPYDHCYAMTAGGQQIIAKPISGSETVTINGTTWHVLSRLRLPSDGTYRLTCVSEGSSTGARYGIGRPPEIGTFVATILLPVAAVGIAIVIAIIVVVRRSSHKRRLQMTPPPS